jgi:hypothetical protein
MVAWPRLQICEFKILQLTNETLGLLFQINQKTSWIDIKKKHFLRPI